MTLKNRVTECCAMWACVSGVVLVSVGVVLFALERLFFVLGWDASLARFGKPSDY